MARAVRGQVKGSAMAGHDKGSSMSGQEQCKNTARAGQGRAGQGRARQGMAWHGNVLSEVVVVDSCCYHAFNGSDFLLSSQLSRLESCIHIRV
jgi:hypothetical protein